VEVRKVAAQIVSRIGLIELPRREWPDLIATLCSATIHKAEDGLRISTL
jgi:hypothetical protein